MIEDRKIATAYAIEATRVFDHLQFRNRMRDALAKKGSKAKKSHAPKELTLQKPKAISGRDPWFTRFYKSGSQAERDRKLFSK